MSQPAPAFQCYSREWLSKTAILSLAARGALWTLLLWSWDNGPIPTAVKTIAKLLHENQRTFRPVWAEIRQHLVIRRGCFVSPELERLRRKQREYRQLQRLKGLASARKRKRNRGSTAVQPRHQPKGNSSSTKDQDQNPDQDQRPRTAARRPRERTTNDRALYKLVEHIVNTRPPVEWSSEAKHQAGRAGLTCTGDILTGLIDSAVVNKHRKAANGKEHHGRSVSQG